jgi:hypothetical protein
VSAAKGLGADLYIRKPSNLEELVEIATVIEGVLKRAPNRQYDLEDGSSLTIMLAQQTPTIWVSLFQPGGPVQYYSYGLRISSRIRRQRSQEPFTVSRDIPSSSAQRQME